MTQTIAKAGPQAKDLFIDGPLTQSENIVKMKKY
jgi:hypothetical protein